MAPLGDHLALSRARRPNSTRCRVSRMLFTASTVKDSAANLRRFVTGNLAGGIDHLVVFVDAPEDTDPEALEVLESHPSVTCVRTDEDWWQGDRPGQLNTRQRINANLTKAVLSRVAGAEWVFHIDADEIAQVDRAALASAPADARVVRLAPLEAVSQREWAADPTVFKRLLDKDDLTLLHTLGVIDRAHNGAYFHGHVDGKAGVRPDPRPVAHAAPRRRRGQERAGAVAAPRPAAAALRVLLRRGLRAQVDLHPRGRAVGELPPGPRADGDRAAHPDRQGAERRAGPALPDADLRAHHRGRPGHAARPRAARAGGPAAPGRTCPRPSRPAPARSSIGLLERLATVPKRAFHPGQPADEVRRLLDQARHRQGSA